MDEPRATVVDVPERMRYEARVAGDPHVATLFYHLHGGQIALTHTEVPAALEGHGVGGTLTRHVLDDARRRGLAVVPRCPFVAAFIRRHREYADLVPAERRGEFGLQDARGAEGA